MITRPRRWGKSINMDMFRCFVEAEVDEFGNDQDHNKYHSLFTEGIYTNYQGEKRKESNQEVKDFSF